MEIIANLLVKDPKIIQGLLDGSLTRFGGVVRETATGRIVRHLVESSSMTNHLMTLPFSPVLGSASLANNIIGNGITINRLNNLIDRVDLVQQTLSPILKLSQIAAGASVLNMGISIAGFAYMGYKLNQIQTTLGKIQQSMEAGFKNIDRHLDLLSGQLAYLHLLVAQNIEEQKHLSQAINQLHRTIFIKEIADLQAELLDRHRFPNSPIQQALKVASRVRLFMSDQVFQIQPELEPQKMLLSDVATQGWAVATATEAYLLLEIGKTKEAKQVLDFEVPKFKQNARQWGDCLLSQERSELNTAYRFIAPSFSKHITQERVERIANISSSDSSLSPEKKEEKKNSIAVESQMFYTSQFDRNWIHKQVAIAEYLDTRSELSARLESLQALTQFCEEKNVKNIRDILPGEQQQDGLYILS